MTAVESYGSYGQLEQSKLKRDEELDKELDWIIDRSSQQKVASDNDSDEVKIRLEMDESEKFREGEGDSADDQQDKYLKQIERDEMEEDEGWGDEEEDNLKVNAGGDSYSPSVHSPRPPPPPPTLASAAAPGKGPKLRVKKSLEDAPPPPASPKAPPPLLASAEKPTQGPKLRIKKSQEDAPPPPPSPGPPPPMLTSASAPAKSPKLRVRKSPEDAPPAPPSPGPPPPTPPSVTAPAKSVKLKVKTKPGNNSGISDSQPSTQTQNQTETKAAPTRQDLSEINYDDRAMDRDKDDQYYSDDNTDDINRNELNGRDDYEAGAGAMKRSNGYDNLNGDANDQQELYAESKSPESDEQSHNWATDEEGYDFPEGFSEDQRQAMAELQQLRLDLNYSEEDPPEYNVAARLRQLNEELAQEDDPDDERERSIKFKDDLIDLVAPPPEYPSEEEGEEVATDRTQDSYGTERPESPASATGYSDDDFEENVESPKQSDPDRDNSVNGSDNSVNNKRPSKKTMDANKKSQVDSSSSDSGDSSTTASVKGTNDDNGGPSGGSDEKILVERDGKFELINVEDLTAEERQLYLPQTASDEDGVDTGRSNGSFEPAPPREPRPATATTSSSRRRIASAPPRRAQSAQAKRVENKPVLEDFNYTSPYALTDQQKKAGKDQKKTMEDRQRKEKQLKKAEEQEQQRENDEAFEAWLSNKRKEIARKRSEENQTQKEQKKTEKDKKKDGSSESLQERDESGAFDSWLKHKRGQRRKEKDEDRKRREYEEGLDNKPKDDSRKAFKQWLKKKKEDSRQARTLEKQRVRVHKLMVRRSHKALQLARAISQSQSFNYVDYYGYRF